MKSCIIGITGSIATGKSLVLSIFSSQGHPTFDCDKEVRKLIEDDKDIASELVSKFPEATKEGKINRKLLRDLIYDDPDKREALEKIIYPKLFEKHDEFIKKHSSRNGVIAVEVPLLYEKNLAKNYTVVILTTSSKRLQLKRAAKRGINKAELVKILKTQLPYKVKKSKADYVINTELSKARIKTILSKIQAKCEKYF